MLTHNFLILLDQTFLESVNERVYNPEYVERKVSEEFGVRESGRKIQMKLTFSYVEG